MEKQIIDTSNPTRIPENRVYEAYCDNYDSIHYLFVEFQFSWLQQAYRALKDLDKYKIMYDRNGENHYDMIKRDDAKNLENYNYIKNQILKY